jgi:hypothetical protein
MTMYDTKSTGNEFQNFELTRILHLFIQMSSSHVHWLILHYLWSTQSRYTISKAVHQIEHLLFEVDGRQVNLAAAGRDSRRVVLVQPEQLRRVVVPLADCGVDKLAKNSGEMTSNVFYLPSHPPKPSASDQMNLPSLMEKPLTPPPALISTASQAFIR